MKEMKPLRISYEFFPPKTADGTHTLLNAAMELANYSPEFFSVTFGAGGSTREGTIEMVNLLHAKTKVAMAPHLSCVGFDRDELICILQQYKALNVDRIVALRGDLPSGMQTLGDCKLAYDLVKLIREVTGDHFYIEVAAYPEYHPQAKNALYDVFNLKKKYEAGANSAITQYFYNSDAYFYFLDECAKQQIFIPIIPGIMPILQFNSLIRFSEVCGAEIPRWLYKRLEAYGDDSASLRAFGVEVVYTLCERLIAGGAPGMHFYTLNRAEMCVQILKQLNIMPTAKEERYIA